MHEKAHRRLIRSLGLAVALSLGLALAGALFVRMAHADAPDPRYCVAAGRMVASPGGGFNYQVTLRDGTNQPIPGGAAVLDFNLGPGIALCAEQDPDHDRRIVGTANSLGIVTFDVRAGGNAGTIEVWVAASVIASVSVRTMDLDGDMDVDQADRDAVAALVGSDGPAGDFDLDGAVTTADRAMLEAKLGGNCTQLDSRPATWGAVKGRYR